jgi:hypothetical protein
MRLITLDLYGFEKKVEVTAEIYNSGSVQIAIMRPLKVIMKEDFGKLIPKDINHFSLRFYRCADGYWRPNG